MQSSNQNDSQAQVDARLRTMRTVWFALVISVGMYFLLTMLTGQPKDFDAGQSPMPHAVTNGTVSIALAAVGMIFVIVSLLIKQKQLSHSVEQQSVAMVQTAYIVALALCEVPALLGLIDHFITRNRYYYVLFIVAVCGQLIHFPRRQDVLNASGKSTF